MLYLLRLVWFGFDVHYYIICCWPHKTSYHSATYSSRLLLGDTSGPASIWPTGDPAEGIVRSSAPIRARLDGSTHRETCFSPFFLTCSARISSSICFSPGHRRRTGFIFPNYSVSSQNYCTQNIFCCFAMHYFCRGILSTLVHDVGLAGVSPSLRLADLCRHRHTTTPSYHRASLNAQAIFTKLFFTSHKLIMPLFFIIIISWLHYVERAGNLFRLGRANTSASRSHRSPCVHQVVVSPRRASLCRLLRIAAPPGWPCRPGHIYSIFYFTYVN